MLKSVSFILLGIVLLIAPQAQAITKRADKECLLCHVLWFNAFNTDQKTLVPSTQSATVVAGSTGLVSTEAMCVTCHDGYVADSRLTVETDNPHHTLKKMPKSLELPERLRLDSNNEVYCGTCHTLHDLEENTQVGSSPFMRMANEKSQMCIACHRDQSRMKSDTNHPVMEKVGDRERINAAKMGSKFSPDRELICQSCHNAHGKRALIAPPQNSSLCVGCHLNKSGLVDSRHDFRSQLPNLENIKQQKPAQSGPCGACHIPHNAAGKKLWARKLNPGPPASQMCLSCHGEHSGIEAKRIGQHSHPVNVQPADKSRIPKNLPLFSEGATRSTIGRIQCFSCHDVHRWNPTVANDKGKPDAEGDGSNSFLRMPNHRSSGLCVACHSDKQQILSSDHNLMVTAPQEENLQSMSAAQSGPCSACHVPHNAAGQRIWAKEMTGDSRWIDRVCISCHHRDGAAAKKQVGQNDHPVNVPLTGENLSAKPETVHQTLPLYHPAGEKEEIQWMACMTCHDPHTWQSSTSGSGIAPYTANVEGDATNSFLRLSNYPSPDLCNTCHRDRSQVEGSVHDLKVSAPQAKNMLGQTVAASGTCGTCHLVHNSPHAVGLWARDLGSVSDDINIIGALCTSCHSKGKAAEKKIPDVASHPVGRLIRSHAGTARGKSGYTPVFDEKGRKQAVGNLGCPSCHDSHQWNPSPLSTAGDKSVRQAKTKTGRFRFLRNQSFNTICMECHGPEGLFRYLYFHEPAKRGIWVRPRQAHDRSRITLPE